MSADGPVLIVTEADDVHADFVVLALNEAKVPVFRFNTEDFPLRASVSVEQDGDEWTGEIPNRHHSVRLDTVRAAWWRRPARPNVDDRMTGPVADYATTQAWETLRCLYGLIHERWLCSPDALRLAENKPVQLLRAAALGLRTPASLLTNDGDRALAFQRRNGVAARSS